MTLSPLLRVKTKFFESNIRPSYDACNLISITEAPTIVYFPDTRPVHY